MDIEEKRRLKIAIIARATRALKYKMKKPSATESEVMNDVTRNLGEILEFIEDDS